MGIGIALGISAAMSIASAAASTIQATMTAKAQKKQQQLANEQTISNTIESYKDLDAEQAEVQRLALEENMRNQLNVAEAQGKARVQRGATGAGDISTMINDINRTGGENLSNIIENREQRMSVMRQKAEQIRQGGIANQDLSIIQKPSWVSAGLDMAGDAAGSYATYGQYGAGN